MISLKDYIVLYSDYFSNSHHNQNQIKSSFNYLYPSEIQPLNKRNFINEKQEMFTVTQLESLQQCEALIQIIKSTYEQILSPSQEFCIIEHRNPNAQRRFLAIASDIQQSSLKKLAQNHFFQNINVPSEQFCTYLIERMLQIHHLLEGKGFHLKVITPEHIVVYQDQIFLNYPFPHDVFDTHGRGFLQQLQEWRQFCAPEILKVFNAPIKIDQIQAKKATNMMQNSDPIYYEGNYEGKQFKKAIIYSLGLTIFYCFGFHIPLQDRIKALKSPTQLNNFMNQLRREIKIHHDGKFISKLLKLMLEHSQSLRDTISTFSYKMNSIQFRLLRRVIVRNNKVLMNQQIVRTQSDANISLPVIMNSAKKTIDIRISSMSNVSSAINKSWLSSSVSQHNNGQCKLSSPLQLVNSLHAEDKQRSKKSLIPTIELNEIKQIKQMEQTMKQQQPSSPIELDVEWDEDSLMRGSDKSSRDRQLENKEKRPQLLNRISEKEGEEEEVEREYNHHDGGGSGVDQFLGQNNNQHTQQHHKLSPLKIVKIDSHISKSQIGSRHSQQFEANNSIGLHVEKRISGTQTRLDSKHSKMDQQEIGSMKLSVSRDMGEKQHYEIVKDKNILNEKIRQKRLFREVVGEKMERQQSLKQQQHQIRIINAPTTTTTNNIPQKPRKTQPKSSLIDQPSMMSLFSKQLSPLQPSLNKSTLNNQSSHPDDQQNQSIIFQEPFFNEEEFKMEQRLIKEKKDREKEKLTQRKKDQYNYRSRVILLVLVVVCGVFKVVEYLQGGK